MTSNNEATKTPTVDDPIEPAIDRSYPIAETAAAIRYLQEGHARGKIVINVLGASQ